MRLSQSFFTTLRENVKDEDSVSGNLLRSCGHDQKKLGRSLYVPSPWV